MGFSATQLLYVMLFFIVVFMLMPALLAIRLAKKQNRSMLTSGFVAFFLGLTTIGGWIYLGIMNLIPSEKY